MTDNDDDQFEGSTTIWWRPGETPPTNLTVTHGIVRDTLIPRTLAWLSIYNNDSEDNKNDNMVVCLLDGYTAACYTPPILFFAASVLPPSVRTLLLETTKQKCTLSAVTTSDPIEAITTAATAKNIKAFTFSELGLQPTESKLPSEYPCPVATSPIHMYCSLTRVVDFMATNNDSMILLTVEKFVIDGSVITPTSSSSTSNNERNIPAIIDSLRISPIVSLGHGRIHPVSIYRSMPRPKQDPNTGTWTSTSFDHPVSRDKSYHDTTTTDDEIQCTSIEWNFRIDGRACSLGFNPTTALIAPRPIGWISTYSSNSHRIPHLAPYSFFIDVAGGSDAPPMVAFSAYVKTDTNNGRRKKDAHKDAEETGYFCFNMPTRDLAVALNYSAAELSREESEFELAGLAYEPARYVDAPIVRDAPIHYECQYVQTIDDVGGFSIVIGKVVAVSVNQNILTDGKIDVKKLQPIMRLGYTDEYCVI